MGLDDTDARQYCWWVGLDDTNASQYCAMTLMQVSIIVGGARLH